MSDNPQKEGEKPKLKFGEVIAKDGTVLKRDPKGKFLPGNTESKRKRPPTEGKIARMFNTADKATISNLAQKPRRHLQNILNDPNSKMMDRVNANLLLKAETESEWRSLLMRIMKTPEKALINIDLNDDTARSSKRFQNVFLIPSNGREG